jgi:preprotein translocase subunit SecA
VVNRIIPSLKIRKITERDEVNAKYAGQDLSKGYHALVDEKNHTVVLTDEGVAKAEKTLKIDNLYNDVQSEWAHHITQALRAYHLYERDVHYIIKDGEIIIVDEFTGRPMPGRRWSDGLHQAIEAKERMAIKEENQTLATITFQNFFKLYKKLSGMTGTAMTEANEFWTIYKLGVVEIPPNKPCARVDSPDIIYKTEREKFNAVADEVERLWKKGSPVLVGTRSIEKSEKLSEILKRRAVAHKVLNAKYHEMEAQIISQAGRKNAVTIATNMAGRGTDIVLGGNPQDKDEHKFVAENGGLTVIGTERHESRRIDNQLRGRCARQGDAGSSKFFVALDDELMRLFGSERISAVMTTLGMKDGESIESRLISRQIEGAQKRVEGHNFDIRKHLLDYDKVMNQQRTAVYNLRNAILDGQNLDERIAQMIEETVEDTFRSFYNAKRAQRSDFASLNSFFKRVFGFDPQLSPQSMAGKNLPDVVSGLLSKIKEVHKVRADYFAEQGIAFCDIERMLLLQILDQSWKQHLYELDQIQKTVGLRAYGQKDPLIEYQKESYALYQNMMSRIRDFFVDYIFRMQLPPRRSQERSRNDEAAQETSCEAKIGRNDACPCGSGKKHKKCCGK